MVFKIAKIMSKQLVFLAALFNRNLLLQFIVMFLISFISWNYFGSVFVFYITYLVIRIEKHISEETGVFLLVGNLIMYISAWHFGGLFWMLEIDQGIYGLLTNMLLYLFPLGVYIFLRKKRMIGKWAFVFIILLYEYYLNISDFSYPWMTIGNVFSNQLYLIEWYEITGVLGGSFWILILGMIWAGKSKYKTPILISLVTIPISISFYINQSHTYELNEPDKNERILTFNLESKEGLVDESELAFYIAKRAKDSLIETILIPELTFSGVVEKKINKKLSIKYLKGLTINNPKKKILVGTSVNKGNRVITNSSLYLNNGDILQKVKKKLVPLNEYLPTGISKYFKKTSFHFNVPDDTETIVSNHNFSPLICYESFYSFFVASQISNARVMYLLSSEKFFNHSYFGRLQYDNIIKLRAIENRLPLVKASNHGTSLVINKYGKIIDSNNTEFSIFDVKIYPPKKTIYNSFSHKRILLLIVFLLGIHMMLYKLKKQ